MRFARAGPEDPRTLQASEWHAGPSDAELMQFLANAARVPPTPMPARQADRHDEATARRWQRAVAYQTKRGHM